METASVGPLGLLPQHNRAVEWRQPSHQHYMLRTLREVSQKGAVNPSMAHVCSMHASLPDEEYASGAMVVVPEAVFVLCFLRHRKKKDLVMAAPSPLA